MGIMEDALGVKEVEQEDKNRDVVFACNYTPELFEMTKQFKVAARKTMQAMMELTTYMPGDEGPIPSKTRIAQLREETEVLDHKVWALAYAEICKDSKLLELADASSGLNRNGAEGKISLLVPAPGSRQRTRFDEVLKRNFPDRKIEVLEEGRPPFDNPYKKGGKPDANLPGRGQQGEC